MFLPQKRVLASGGMKDTQQQQYNGEGDKSVTNLHSQKN